MKQYISFFAAIGLILGFASCLQKKKQLEIIDLKCEYMDHPISIDTKSPRFSWIYKSTDNQGFKQKTYKVDVALSKEMLVDEQDGDIWSSGLVNSAVSFSAPKKEIPLKSHTKYYWRVLAWGSTPDEAIVSRVDSFETAKLSTSDWQAKWITDEHNKEYGPAPMLRKSFNTQKGVLDAKAYVSATAYYQLWVNGKEAQATSLEPGYTHYDKRNLYTTIDVTKLLKEGENVLGAVLGNGFYNEDAPVATWDFEKARWRDRAKFIMELHVVYTDGSKDVIHTDNTWTTTTGASVYNNIYSGETYDARLEKEGWSTADFDDSEWKKAVTTNAPSPMLVAQQVEPVKVTKELPAVSMKSFGDTLHVFDFGINLTGVCKINLRGEKGTKVTLMHGELIRDDGRVEMRNIDIYYKPMKGIEFQTDTYFMKGEGDEVFIPKFTYHGFQYVEVKSDRPLQLKKEDITALFMHTAVEPVGHFSCSNELLNKIWEATRQAYLCNLHSIPTDCPQREKNGWTADAHIVIDVALQNFDGIKLYEKWMNDFIDNQREEGNISGIIPSSGWGYDDWIGPVWDAALFIIPDAIAKYYGDTRTIHNLYETCERYLRYLKNREDENGTVTYGIGDWVYYDTQTPTDYTTTCFYYLDNKLMAHFAEITGNDPSPYSKKAESLKDFINKKYFDIEKSIYANGSQAAQAVALELDIVPEEYIQKVADRLNKTIVENNYFLDFGVLGSKYVPRALTRHGYIETVYKMATQEEAPSWGNWIKNGLTTLGETWVLSPEFRDASVNHVFLGDISSWMTRSIAGIDCLDNTTGFNEIVIKPHYLEDLTWAKGEYQSVKGLITSEWRRDGNKIKLDVVIPENTSATIYIDKELKVDGGKHHFIFEKQ